MRVILGVALALFAAPSMAADPLPVFDFKGFVAGEVVSAKALKDCDDRNGEISCRNKFDKIAGVFADTRIRFAHGKLSSVYATADRAFYPAFRDAFAAKYGKPCKVEATTLKNSYGAEFERHTQIWCFATGKLYLEDIGSNLSQLTFGYMDDNQPPKKEPKIDF